MNPDPLVGNEQYIRIYKKELMRGFVALGLAVTIGVVAFLIKLSGIFYVILGCCVIAAFGIISLAIAVSRKLHKSIEPGWMVMTYNSAPRQSFFVTLLFGVPAVIKILIVNWFKKPTK